jgi:hypothetical protein
MYNLTVDKAHTFFVGDGQWLVHNGCQNLKFWNEPIEIGGRRVYQRNDLFELTPSNISLMEQGMAPFGYDGKRVVLHHLTQDEPGALAEVAGRYHEVNTKTLHGFEPDGKSFRQNPALDQQFANYRSDYWRTRLQQMQGGVR